MDKFITSNPARCFRPILFALNNDPESGQPMIDFLTSKGMTYLGKQNKDDYGFSRENVFTVEGTNFKLVIHWMRNECTIQYKPDGWDGAFTESYFDNIRECMTGYGGHTSLSFCYGDIEIMKLAIPKAKGGQA